MKESNIKYLENVETIQNVLQDFFLDDELKVKEIECEAGSKDGDNYMSLIKRVLVRYHRPENKSQFVSLIVKRHVLNNKQRELFRCDPAFKNEINAYKAVIPTLRKFLHRDDELPFPNCFFAGSDSKGEIIVLEDLCQMGYEMAVRKDYLDYDHCEAMIKGVAKLHAASLVMKAIRPQEFRQQIIPYLNNAFYSDSNSHIYGPMLECSIVEATTSVSMHSNPSGEFDKVIEILLRVGGKRLYEIIKDELIYDKSDEWNAVIHADLWINNMMFLKENGVVKNAAMVDFQVMRYGNIVTDLISLLYATTSRLFREKYLDQLLRVYHESLISCLKRALSNRSEVLSQMEKEFTLQNIRVKFSSHALLGLTSTLMYMPAITYDSLTPIIESILDERLQQKALVNAQPQAYHDRVRDLFEDFKNNGYILSLS